MRSCRVGATTLLVLLGVSPAAGLVCGGITEPIRDATLSATVPGTIAVIHVDEGDRVAGDEVLVELDKELEELEVERRKMIWESKVEVDSAEQRAETVKRDLDGTRQLFETTRSVSQDELEQKELEYKLAVAEWDRLKLAEDRERIEYRMAEEQLRRREIRSPMDGTVAEVFIEEGEGCETREPIIRIVQTREVRFVTNIDARIARNLRLGAKVSLDIEGGADSIRREGEISFISPVVDPASGLQEVKAVFGNEDGEVRPGVAGVMILDD
jgi:RND family efflux transporter MFP subunit